MVDAGRSFDFRGIQTAKEAYNAIERIPHNLEAEQALLGAVLFDAEALNRADQALRGVHFYEPFHQRLFEALRATVASGLGVEIHALSEEFRGDLAFRELGGLKYLSDLMSRSPPLTAVAPLARTVLDLAMRRQLINLGVDLASWAALTREGDDFVEAPRLIALAEAGLLAIQVQSRRDELVSLAIAAQGVMDYVDDRVSITGASTGIRPIDLQLGPMLAGDLITLGGRPSMGKSALALAIALNVAAPGLADHINGRDYDGRPAMGVVEIHGEMSWNDSRDGKDRGGQSARRHLADVGYSLFGKDFPTYKQMRDKAVSYDQRQMMATAFQQLDQIPIVGLKKTGITIATLRSILRRQKTAWDRLGIPMGLVIIDHVGLMKADGASRGRYEAQTDISLGCKEMADELETTVLALVQLSRDIEKRDDKRPQLSDLRDSGAWEENADISAFVYRDAYYAKREAEPDAGRDPLGWDKWDRRVKSMEIDVIMGKIREGDGGAVAKVWGNLPWNAIRGAEPEFKGGLV